MQMRILRACLSRRTRHLRSVGDIAGCARPPGMRSGTGPVDVLSPLIVPPDRRNLRSLGPGEHLGHERVEITAWKEKARQSERLAGLDVPGLISDYEAAVELHRPVLDEI